MPVTVRWRKERTVPKNRTSTRWKVGRVNATENAQTSGSAALGRRNISDSIPVRWTVIIRECTGESDLFGVRVHKNRRLKTAKVELSRGRIGRSRGIGALRLLIVSRFEKPIDLH